MKIQQSVLKVVTTIAITSLFLSGCSTIKGVFGKRDNGSLDYQSSNLLAPIQIPSDKQTQPFTPLYPTIDLGDSKINMTNEAGKQYQLPAPKRAVR